MAVSPQEELVRPLLEVPKPLLIVGAGGIGSEVVHALLPVFRGSITLVDMDTIEVSNLNRQAFFTESDLGENKAERLAAQAEKQARHRVEASFIAEDIHHAQFSVEFFRGFYCVIGCVDNVAARQRINTMCFLAGVPWIEAGSAGYFGQVSTIVPGVTECFACAGESPEHNFPVCTIRGRPTEWVHCVHWAVQELIPQLVAQVIDGKRSAEAFSAEQADRVDAVQLAALVRQVTQEGGVEGVEEGERTEGASASVKNVGFIHAVAALRAAAHSIAVPGEKATEEIVETTVPSLITTNTILGSLMVLELALLAKGQNRHLFYLAHQPPIKKIGVGQPVAGCAVCSCKGQSVAVNKETTLEEIITAAGVAVVPGLEVVRDGRVLLYDDEFPEQLTATAAQLSLSSGTILRVHTPEKIRLVYMEVG